MVDFGEVSSMLGIKVARNWVQGTMTLSQPDYIEDLLEKF
jgi:hypothetical protein